MEVKVQNFLDSDLWGDVEIICPICRAKKIINIPKRIIDESKQLTSILIPMGRICNHTFIPFIDKQFKVRGYQKLDVLLDDIESKAEPIIEVRPEDIDVIEIKMNLKLEMYVFAIHGCISKNKILIVIENRLKYLKDTIVDFFDYIFQTSFNNDISIQIKDDYKKNDPFYDDYIVLYEKKIIGKYKSSLNLEDLKIEDETVKKFYKEGNSVIALKNLRDDLKQLYALSQKLIEFYKKEGIDQPLKSKKAIKYLEDTHFIKIKKSYFNLLIQISEKYFNAKITLIEDKLEEMIDQMWGA